MNAVAKIILAAFCTVAVSLLLFPLKSPVRDMKVSQPALIVRDVCPKVKP